MFSFFIFRPPYSLSPVFLRVPRLFHVPIDIRHSLRSEYSIWCRQLSVCNYFISPFLFFLFSHADFDFHGKQGLFSRITFREPVFLGGIGNITGLEKRLPVVDGMTGCIRKFVANEHEYVFATQTSQTSSAASSSSSSSASSSSSTSTSTSASMPSGDITQGFDVRKYIFDSDSVSRASSPGPFVLKQKRKWKWHKSNVIWFHKILFASFCKCYTHHTAEHMCSLNEFHSWNLVRHNGWATVVDAYTRCYAHAVMAQQFSK